MSKRRVQLGKRPFPTLTTPRLILRELNIGDAHDFYRILSDPLVLRYYLNDGPTSLEQAKDRLIQRINRWPNERGIRWGITFSHHNRIIGTCGFQNWNKRDRLAEIGYEIDAKYWRQGIATEAIGAIVAHGFTKLSLNRIEAWIVQGNTGSEKVVQKLGFQLEGTLRESAYWQSEFKNLQIFSLLAREWPPSATPR